MRSVAVVLAITGQLGPGNVDTLAAHVTRFTSLGDPLVVDVGDLELEDAASLLRLVSILAAECHLHNAAWVLVAATDVRNLCETVEEAILLSESLPEALQQVVGAIKSRRNLRLAM